MNIMYRNPFAMRASEKIAEDDTFIRLFSMESLIPFNELFRQSKLWGNVLWIQSPPGAGKTTLLRLFSPSVLNKINRYRTTEEYKPVYQALKNLDVFKSGQISKVGVYLLIDRNFAYIEDLSDFTNPQKMHVFIALLNARVVLSIIKTIIELKGIDLNELSEVSFNPPASLSFPKVGLNFPCNCADLFSWADNIEDQICKVLDNIVGNDNMSGHINLFSFDLFKSEYFKYKNQPICEEFIFQLDDAHKITKKQRECLTQELVAKRITSSLWIAERLELLSIKDIIHSTNKEGRDSIAINLENDISEKYFYSEVQSIAAKRSLLSNNSFRLESSLDNEVTIDFEASYQKVVKDCKNRIFDILNGRESIDEWLTYIEGLDSIKNQAVAYKAVLLFLERDIELPLFPYTMEDFARHIDNPLKSLAENLLNSEYNLPMYYGFKTLNILASNNVEQFVDFSFKLYESLISKSLLSRTDIRLEASEQDKIIRRHAKAMFENVANLPMGSKLQQFVLAILKFCYDQTHERGSSYRIVTGFAVSQESGTIGKNNDLWYYKNENSELAEILRIALANNLFKIKKIKQGGDEWTVFYINRWLCAFKGLPLDYGGWRKLKVKDLNLFVKS